MLGQETWRISQPLADFPRDRLRRVWFSTLLMASGGEENACLRVLLESGADPNEPDYHGRTPLMCDLHSAAIRLLLTHGANVHAADESGKTALHHTAMHACKRIAQRRADNLSACVDLIRSGANVNAKDHDCRSPLFFASNMDTVAIDVGLALIQAGADDDDLRNMPTEFKSQCFLLAVRTGRVHAIRRFVQAGTSVEERDREGNTALLVAANCGYEDIVSALIEAGANVDAANSDGDTALMIAARWDQSKDIIDNLLKAGANVDMQNKCGDTALIIAEENSRTSIFNKLILAGAYTDRETDLELPVLSLRRENRIAGYNPARRKIKPFSRAELFQQLRNAARTGDVSDLVKLIGMGCTVDDCGSNGWTALHHACYSLQTKAVKWLLANGADVMSLSSAGTTALHLATKAWPSDAGRVVQQRLEVICALLANGADRNAKDNDGQTPVDLAKKQNLRTVLLLFSQTQSFQELIMAGGEATRPDTVALRFGGPPGAGKTTLTNALRVTRFKSHFRYEGGADHTSDMNRRTKGINCQSFVDENAAKFSLFDLGGQGEFLSSHQMFIGDGTVPVIDCVVVSALDEDFQNSVFKWCSLFASRNQPIDTPWPLLLIAAGYSCWQSQPDAKACRCHNRPRNETVVWWTLPPTIRSAVLRRLPQIVERPDGKFTASTQQATQRSVGARHIAKATSRLPTHCRPSTSPTKGNGCSCSH